jgi:hypothetical protein
MEHTMRVSVTGSQEIASRDAMTIIYNALELARCEWDITEVTTGGCAGVDTYTASIFHDVMPPEVLKRGCFPDGLKYNLNCHTLVDVIEMVPGGYLKRDDRLVYHADILLAFPRTAKEQQRSGTWATIRRGVKKGIRVEVYPLNGDDPYTL